MSTLCERLSTDIAGQLAFGQGLNTQVEDTNRGFPWAMVSMNALVSIFTFAKSIQSIVQKRIALLKDSKHDLYSIAGDVGPNGEGLGRSGTTLSAALSAIFFYLSRNPTAYSRLATEIRTTFSSGQDIQSGLQLSKCRYLRASIDETLRMAPPFLGTFWREPCSDYTGTFVVDEHVMPPGIMVGVNPYCVMHNEEYFPEAFVFRPERWLGPEKGDCGASPAQKPLSTMRSAFAPFALGETGCLGKAMAYHEMSLVIAKTLWYFNFEKAPGEAGKFGEGRPGRTDGRHRVGEYQLYDLVVADHEGPNLVFTPRGSFGVNC
ncbi:benzoate 4-monooxygenase cytochrome P450 protein [Rutstroemia sp. NJR-2017a WRK4]|nr:benzoate 4-monooxygenase cytochrome P450 protein [Rutstroemia sp. NJR-2017a WRK4]